MSDIFRNHRGGFWTPARKRSLYLGLLLVVLSLIVQVGAGEYSSHQATLASPAGDIFLDNLPVVDLGFVIVFCSIATWFIACGLMVLRPRYLLFGVKMIALFIVFRAFFISLTHIGIYPTGIAPDVNDFGWGLYHLTTFQGNYFFSGHTGYPFLMALIFWDNNFWRRFFLGATVVFAVSVLLAHVHYSIDVFAAPFIVYGIFVMGSKIFKKDYALLTGSGV